ncbi:prolactin-like [Fukomys damarensis]|uniref:prolactin-like n=1 Tax=Fukomys damarensis TaxID=885580 RepID=UPI00053F7FD1|nr:prolactin-like [Fukomys damarensis]
MLSFLRLAVSSAHSAPQEHRCGPCCKDQTESPQTDVYSHHPGYFSPAKKMCHTFDILTPDERQDAKLMPTDVYSHHPGYFSPAKKMCHTFDILTPDERQDAKLMPKEDIMKVVFQLVDSWNEALQELVVQENHPPKLYDILSTKDQIIYLKYQELKKAIIQIGIELDLEVSEEKVVALSLDLKSLKSTDEKQHLFTVYNMLRCFVEDADKIKFLLYFLKCQAAKKDKF